MRQLKDAIVARGGSCSGILEKSELRATLQHLLQTEVNEIAASMGDRFVEMACSEAVAHSAGMGIFTADDLRAVGEAYAAGIAHAAGNGCKCGKGATGGLERYKDLLDPLLLKGPGECSVKQLRAAIARLGGSSAGALEKSELQKKLHDLCFDLVFDKFFSDELSRSFAAAHGRAPYSAERDKIKMTFDEEMPDYILGQMKEAAAAAAAAASL